MEDEDWDLLDITEGKNRIVVFNKKDLIDVPGYGIYISAKEGNISALIKEINERFAFCKDAVEKPALSNERHIGLLRKARVSLNDAREAIARGTELDLVCVDLHEAHNAIREIEGTYTKENLLDDIFSRFCLGK
ncbi:MAG: tRNA uridine-5-carboxymethylaminomethyl(34) synthesis GTPase MnmE, partial [Erysipelotrichales bacterium]|nr:tRNA uridine-5-carboxymethylaminomethyl(34) synthesis GTPase MnmE [Erysipelotrichales bacterium]